MSDLVVVMEEYLGVFRAHGGTFFKADPVTDAEVGEVEELLGVSVPEEVLGLWRWANGMLTPVATSPRSEPLFPVGMTFWGLEMCARGPVRHRDQYAEIVAGLESTMPVFEPFPSLLFGDGANVVQVAVSLRDEDLGSVWLWEHFGYSSSEQVFGSIEEMVRFDQRLIEERLLVWDPGFEQFMNRPGDTAIDGVEMPLAWRRANELHSGRTLEP